MRIKYKYNCAASDPFKYKNTVLVFANTNTYLIPIQLINDLCNDNLKIEVNFQLRNWNWNCKYELAVELELELKPWELELELEL